MAKIFCEIANGYIHEVTNGDFLDSYQDFDGMVIADIPLTDAEAIYELCADDIVSYIENGRVKVKIRHQNGKWYLVKKHPDWRMKYVAGVFSSTYFDFPENTEIEVV